jgi:hypothetical protein
MTHDLTPSELSDDLDIRHMVEDWPVGTRVAFVAGKPGRDPIFASDPPYRSEGVIVGHSDSQVGVAFDDFDGHGCHLEDESGTPTHVLAPDGNGWWCQPGELEEI